jgi:peptide deformylase
VILPLIKYGNPILRRVCESIDVFDESLEALSKSVVETLVFGGGLGLAAPQVGVSKRLIAINDCRGGLKILVNPKITYRAGSQYEEEGCLSVPNFTARILRPFRVVVSAQDIYGNLMTIEGQELLARILEHEIDHLDGILFVDYTPMERMTP